MLLETTTQQLVKWASTDLATTTYSVTIASSIDEPKASATRAILDLGMTSGGATSSNILKCMPVVVGANNAVITGFRVYGWTFSQFTSGTAAGSWEPWLLFEMGAVAGNMVGATGSAWAGYYKCDTLSMIIPAAIADAPWLNFLSPAGVTADLPGWFRFDAQGFQKVEVVVDLGANATGFNVFVAGY